MKKPIIIPISGKAQHGKDFCGLILKEKLEQQGNKVLVLHFADYLKYICKEYFNWDGKKDDKGRTILQYIGTDKARNNNPDIWVNVIRELIDAIGEDYNYILIPDSRFPNENDVLKQNFEKVFPLRVERLNFTSTLTNEQLNHKSETALDDYNFFYYLKSESGRDNMEFAVYKFLGYLREVISQ